MTKLILTFLSFGLYLTASAQCQADFTYSVNNGTVTFTNTSTGGGLFNSWTFGDGSTSYQSNPTHTYNTSGGYAVCLTIYDSLSQCQDTYCDSVFVQTPPCQASFTYSVNNGTVNFTNTSSGPVLSSWTFGDGNTSYQTNPSHTYTVTGGYAVCLTVYDSLTQNQCTYCDSIFVQADTTGGGGGTGCNTISNAYGAGSTIVGAASGASSYDWIVYDASWNFLYNTQNQNFNYNPGSNGLYNVCLTTYDSQQNYCDSACYMVQIQDTLGGGGSGCLTSSGVSIDSTGGVYGNASGAVSYTWTVYDDMWNYLYSSNSSNLYYQPGGLGTYNVCLTAYDTMQVVCDSVCYTLLGDSLAGFDFEEEEIIFNVYPNPTQGVVHVEVSNDQISEIILIDITGAVLLQEAITESTKDIDLSLYPNGMYFIHALGRNGQRLSTSKVLRQ